MNFPIDLSQYRSSTSNRTKIRRALWHVIEETLFRFSPTKAFAWRRFLLRMFGARVTSTSYIYPSVKIWDPKMLQIGSYSSIAANVDCYCVGLISIGNHCTISRDAFLCTGSHDISTFNMPLVTKSIAIHDGAWICGRAYVGPGITVGEGSVLAACGVAVRDIDPWTIVGGNPARVLGTRTIGAEK